MRNLRDPAFLALLARIARRAKGDFARGGRAGGRGRLPGGGSSFREHRRYVPGDEPRTIDWNVFARLGEPFVKVFEPEGGGSLGVVLDVTPSMEVGEALESAVRIAAALGYIVLERRGGAVALAATDGRLDVYRGPPGVEGMLARLSAVLPSRGESLPGAARRLEGFAPGHGLLVTDGEPPEEVDRALAFLPRGKTLCVQVLSRGDLHPALEGELSLVDPERGRRLAIRPTGALLARYRRLARVRVEEVEAVARRRGASFARAFAEEPFEAAVLALIERAGRRGGR
ncbi:MAG TPA: DUF58 domain-containing protein [Planctomycetota bacterium]|nr:DUF58 domain-containing protein [Planctomycetota bacterium]